MEIFVLGSCSGTEPQAGRHHTSWVLRYRNELYWFDAGENCSYTAHLAGLDLLTSRAVFISHPHIDHIGGLPNLYWTIAKLHALRKEPLDVELPVYTSSPAQIEAIFRMLAETEFPCTSPVHKLQEGIVIAVRRYRHLELVLSGCLRPTHVHGPGKSGAIVRLCRRDLRRAHVSEHGCGLRELYVRLKSLEVV